MINAIQLHKLNREICLSAIPYLLKEVEYDFVGDGKEYHKVILMGINFNDNMVVVDGNTVWPGRRDGTSKLRLDPTALSYNTYTATITRC